MSAPTITPNPSGTDPAPGMLYHHAARMTWPDGTTCDVTVKTSVLLPGNTLGQAAYEWATSVGPETRARLGHAVADALANAMAEPGPARRIHAILDRAHVAPGSVAGRVTAVVESLAAWQAKADALAVDLGQAVRDRDAALAALDASRGGAP